VADRDAISPRGDPTARSVQVHPNEDANDTPSLCS
jgi:hypothetical protein